MRGDAMHGFTAAAPRSGITDIPETEHTYQPFVLGVDDGKAPHLLALHNASCGFDIVRVETEKDAFRHEFARGGAFWVTSHRDAATDNIAIGHHTNQSIVLPDGDCADVVCAHQSSELFHGRPWINPRDAPVHCLFHFHGPLLFCADPAALTITLAKRSIALGVPMGCFPGQTVA